MELYNVVLYQWYAEKNLKNDCYGNLNINQYQLMVLKNCDMTILVTLYKIKCSQNNSLKNLQV